MHLLSLSLCVLRHPVDTFHVVQRTRERFSFLPALILLTLTVLARLAFIQTVHYPLQATDPRYSNWIMETAMYLAPLLSIAVCGFAVSSILDGEMMMRESLTAVAYSMMPYLVFILLLSALSHLLGQESSLFSIIECAIWAWCIVLYIVSMKTMNSYTFAKTLLVLLLTVLLIALMWAVALLLYAMGNQFKDFLVSVYREFKYVIRR